MNESELKYIYDVVCPVCGCKPSYVITGINENGLITGFRTDHIHSEVEDILYQREQEVRERWNEDRNAGLKSVHLHIKTKD